jgi:hypothetical protein
MVVRIDATLDEQGDECRLVMIDVTEDNQKVAHQRDMERQHQEILARQTLALWFKGQDGRLISTSASLLADWDLFSADALKAKPTPSGLASNYLSNGVRFAATSVSPR